MSLFNFGKKKEKNNASVSSFSRGCSKAKDSKCSVKVLGAGCKNCHQLYESVKKAVTEMELSIEVEYITDMEKIMKYGVMRMPAIVVNEKVVSQGKVLKMADIKKLLENNRT